MAETEVESILREIRERVLSQQRADQDVAAARSPLTNGGNGAGESDVLQQVALHADAANQTSEDLSLINSYLTTTARAWDRLPPLVSNRSGIIARVELWLKRQLKRATRWFTWEQVNFNAAVHQALRDLPPLLAAHEHELGRLRAQLEDLEARSAQLVEAEARRAELELERCQEGLNAQLKQLQLELRIEIGEQRRASETRNNQVDARLTELREEQRVCFKQLALETSEAAALEDRARRKTEALLEELQRRIADIEKGKK